MDRTIGAQLIRPDRPIYTRSGWEIPQVTKLPRDIKLNAIRAQAMKVWRRNPILRSTSNYPYNCVGMIFASRRALIEITHIYDILTNDYYKKVSRDEVMAGDVVLYKLDSDVTHVGLVIRAELVHPTSRTLDITMLAHVNYKCAATSVAIKAGVLRLRLI